MYVAKDEGSGFEKELDSDQTKIMEEGGKKKKPCKCTICPVRKLSYLVILNSILMKVI